MLDDPSQRISQKFLNEGSYKHVRAVDQSLLKAGYPFEPGTAGKISGGVNRLFSFGLAPAADRVIVLQRKAQRIHQTVAARTSRIGAVLDQPLPNCQAAIDRLVFQRRNVRRCAGGGGTPIRFSSTQCPRITGEVRVLYEVTVRMLPWRSSPPLGVSPFKLHAPEPAPINMRYPVVLGEAFIQIRVVGAEQVEDASILPDRAFQKQFCFAAHRLPQIVIKARE